MRAERLAPLRALTPADIEAGINRALEAHDIPAVYGLLHLLAARDPRRAQDIIDTIQLGIEIHRAARGEHT